MVALDAVEGRLGLVGHRRLNTPWRGPRSIPKGSSVARVRYLQKKILPDVRVLVDTGFSGQGEVESSGRTRTGRPRKPRRSKAPRSSSESSDREPSGSPDLVEALRKRRLREARRRIPAFRILTNRALDELARAKPTDEESLLAVKGIGPAIAGKYGEEILRIFNNEKRICSE